MSALVYEICREIEVSAAQRDDCLRRLRDLARGMTEDEIRAARAGILDGVKAWNCEDAAELALMIDAMTLLAERAGERGQGAARKPDTAVLEKIPRPDAELSRLLEQVRAADPGNLYVAIDKRGRVVELSDYTDQTRNPYGVYVSKATDILRYAEAAKTVD